MKPTSPIKDAQAIKLGASYIADNYDAAYWLLWRLLATTGIRISDAIALKWDFIDWDSQTLRIIESKGTLSAQARAKNKVLMQIKSELLAGDKAGPSLWAAPASDVLSYAPENLRPVYQQRIDKAIADAPAKGRTVDLCPKLLKDLGRRYKKYSQIDGGYIFSINSMETHHASHSKKPHISRQSAWRVFREAGYYLRRQGYPVKGSCHGLRKTYAYQLQAATGNAGLVVKTLNWSSIQVANRYLGLDDDERKAANKAVFKNLT